MNVQMVLDFAMHRVRLMANRGRSQETCANRRGSGRTGHSGARRICTELTDAAEITGGIKKAKNLVRFGTVGVLDGPQVIVPQGLGA